MTERIDKHIQRLDDDIATALNLIKDTISNSHDTDDEKVRKIVTFSNLLKHCASQKSALELLKEEVQNEN